MSKVKIGIIGGSGFYKLDALKDPVEKSVNTPFGEPSDALVSGKIEGVDCVVLARHNRKHGIMPTNINYRANIWALKEEGCTHVLVSTACGSLQEEIAPGDLVILDQFIDRTTKRMQTFYDGTCAQLPGICHLPVAEPFCSLTRDCLKKAAEASNIPVHPSGTCVTIEGPRFSSKAESFLFKSWGGHVINMTTVPECILAKEAGLCYAAIAMATDYDCWHPHNENVNVELALTTFRENVGKVTQVLCAAVPIIAKLDWTFTLEELKDNVQQNVMS
ncbi:S-methyl-5'-thioadenosine phosphorylase-like [Daphnia carinata]|uniref:S-methyl-5'-thioadenosine phosphorylase-like n=1 Tax=Daphnia carinata TaxID=120202 RepID=UPI00257F97B2|nr:S-methyl-5'-thioadenosine phosphorylase-like [Daphnia carinata]